MSMFEESSRFKSASQILASTQWLARDTGVIGGVPYELEFVAQNARGKRKSYIQWNPAITKCHGTEKNVRYSGVFVIAKTPL